MTKGHAEDREAILKQLRVELERLDRENPRDESWGNRAARKVLAIAEDIRVAFGIPGAVKTAGVDVGGERLEAELEDLKRGTDPRAVKTSPTIHVLKSWPRFFAAIVDGSKTFELRDANERTFEVGDFLQLYEWEPGHVGAELGETTVVPGATGREAFLEILGVSILAGQVRFDSGSSDGPSLSLAGRLAVLSIRLSPTTPEEA